MNPVAPKMTMSKSRPGMCGVPNPPMDRGGRWFIFSGYNFYPFGITFMSTFYILFEGARPWDKT